ncbi:uncharacterized protein A4U43_C02F21870 [Asparagus officinalis]|uniref:Pseudouridine synthase RsuA/RluA-like domain-containing protein n=2 Tax=Asparagus officinalis TaxID=4686 RepID=A0A5P1FKX1_ASPOF|nr:uncharacterized protein A4U43_C02F21870 [Asparagus officinalis]
MVVTKSNKVAAKLVKAFTNRRVKKTYLALCISRAPNWDKIRITSGHGRSKFGAWRVYSLSDVGRSLPGGSTVRDMTTSFEVLSINNKGKYREPADMDTDEFESIVVEGKGEELDREGEDVILVRAYPKSGRTHQIRLHCQYLGIPIRGDVKYCGVREWEGMACDGHALHAESLSFAHPITGEFVQLCAPVPLWVEESFGDVS